MTSRPYGVVEVMRNERPRAAANTALLVSSVLVSIGAVEAVVRIREAVMFDTYDEGGALGLHQRSDDPVLVYETRPGAQVERDGTVYRINAQGLRRSADPADRQPGERRILLLRDSITFGLGIDESRTFAHLLERGLNASGSHVKVLNRAVLGYRVEQEVVLYQRRGRSFAPHGVLLAFCLNDCDDYSGELPLFDTRLTVHFRQAPRRVLGTEWPDPIPILDRSLLFAKLAGRLFHVDYYQWIAADASHRSNGRRAFEQLAAALRQDNVPGRVVIFPLLSTDAHGRYRYGAIQRDVAAPAANAGLPLFDLLDGMAAAGLETFRLTPRDVLHLNENGHAAAARALRPCLADPRSRCPSPGAAQPAYR